MTVKDLLESADREDIAGRIAQRYGNGQSAAQKHILEAYDQMLGIEAAETRDNLIVCVKIMGEYSAESEEYFSIGLYKKGEMFKQGYSVESCPWPELLGSDVARTSIELYGSQECAAAIYEEMTYFGYWQEEWDAEIEKLGKSLDEAVKDIAAGRTYSLEDVLEELGIVSGERGKVDDERWRKVSEQNQRIVQEVLEREKKLLDKV